MLVVVGGHSRNIGKTAVVAGLIRALPERNWTAVKVTQFGHGICSSDGEACHCNTGTEHPCTVTEQTEADTSDTGRFLKAGARHSYWLRTAVGQLGCAVPDLRRIFGSCENVIVESNSILQFFKPDVFLMVLDFAREDFKPSSLRYLDRADAYVVIDSGINVPLWKGVSRGLWDRKTQFTARPPRYVTAAMAAFVSERLEAASSCSK